MRSLDCPKRESGLQAVAAQTSCSGCTTSLGRRPLISEQVHPAGVSASGRNTCKQHRAQIRIPTRSSLCPALMQRLTVGRGRRGDTEPQGRQGKQQQDQEGRWAMQSTTQGSALDLCFGSKLGLGSGETFPLQMKPDNLHSGTE